jgi:predicted nucleotidyltransferase
MLIGDQISKEKKDFILLCKSHNVKYLYAFGSATDDRFDPERSDIDLLVEID